MAHAEQHFSAAPLSWQMETINPPMLPAGAGRVSVKSWLREIVCLIGPGCHPDTRAFDYIDRRDCRAILMAAAAECLDTDIDRAFALLGAEVYVHAGRAQRLLFRRPRPLTDGRT